MRGIPRLLELRIRTLLAEDSRGGLTLDDAEIARLAHCASITVEKIRDEVAREQSPEDRLRLALVATLDASQLMIVGKVAGVSTYQVRIALHGAHVRRRTRRRIERALRLLGWRAPLLPAKPGGLVPLSVRCPRQAAWSQPAPKARQ